MLQIKTDTLAIRVPVRKNQLLKQALEEINANVEVRTLWKVGNVNAIERLGMSDHGPVHFQIVANIALRISRLLHKHNVDLSITRHFELSYEYGELVILLGSLLHDIGMTIDRQDHETHSLFIARDLMKAILHFLPSEERIIVISEVLHTIISHRKGGTPLTIEAGIVRVADALDMSQGRSRIPYEQGKVNIHSLSAYAIENITVLFYWLLLNPDRHNNVQVGFVFFVFEGNRSFGPENFYFECFSIDMV
jgi:hypothetical protein